MKNIVVLFDLHGILDLSNPIIKQKLDNTFIILQPSCTLATQWASCCNLYHIAQKNKIALDIYFLNEEQEMYDVLALDTICHPYLASMPDLLKSPIVHFHHITWRSLTYSKRADYEHKITFNKTSQSTTPEFSYIVLDTIVTELRTKDLLLERRFVLPISLLFILTMDTFFKHSNNPINGYHHFVVKTSSTALKNAVFAMHCYYQALHQRLKKDFDNYLSAKINRNHQFYAHDDYDELPALPACQPQLATPFFYTPIQDELKVKDWLMHQKNRFANNVDNFTHDIDKWFKKHALLTHRQIPNRSLDDFVAYLAIKEPINQLNEETLSIILSDINRKRKDLSAFSNDLNFTKVLNAVIAWKRTHYERIMVQWIRMTTKRLFIVNIIIVLLILLGFLFTATYHQNTTSIFYAKLFAFETIYFKLALAVMILGIVLLSIGVLFFKRSRTKKAVQKTIDTFNAIEKEAILHAKDIQRKYNHQLEALILGKNENLVFDILKTYQQHKEQLLFVFNTLNTYQAYAKIDNPSDSLPSDNPQLEPTVLFNPIHTMDFLQWGIHKKANGVKLHNLTANDNKKDTDEFRLMMENLFGIEEIFYK